VALVSNMSLIQIKEE